MTALLDDRKTRMRSALKPANPKHAREMGGYWPRNGLWVDGYLPEDTANGHVMDYSVSECWSENQFYIDKYAKYKPGDILYVQETWRIINVDADNSGMAIVFRVDDTVVDVPFAAERFARFEKFAHKNGWLSPRSMPIEAARFFLRVGNVRIEPLKDITVGEIEREGLRVKGFDCPVDHPAYPGGMRFYWARMWDSVISKEDKPHYGWVANPWVWVYEFEKCAKDEPCLTERIPKKLEGNDDQFRANQAYAEQC